MKPMFDVQDSLSKCDPSKLYAKGITFKKRLVLKRGKNGVVTYSMQGNPRVLHVQMDKVPVLRDSFAVNGFVNSNPPPTVKVDPNNTNRFIGLSGYHRDAAAEQLGWDTMIYDVLEFDSPLDERKHRSKSNQHKFPSIPNTLDDIVKQIKEAVAAKEIQNDDVEIKLLIADLASDKTSQAQTKIFRKFRQQVSASSTIRNYHTQGGVHSTEEFALDHDLPFGGDKSFSYNGKLGYLTGIKTPKTTLYDAKKLSKEYGGKDVEIYSWIQDNPKEAPAIYTQRAEWEKTFNAFVRADCEFMQDLAKKCGVNVKLEDLIKNHPVKFKGFLAQDISPDPTNGGNPKESGIVDANGNPI